MAKKAKIEKVKQYGITAIKATINSMAKARGNVKNKNSLKNNVLIIKDELKREMLSNKIFIKEIQDPEDIDRFPAHKPITVCLNPYYELAMIQNLKPFPIDMSKEENLKWLSNFEYYLAMHLLYFRDFGKMLNSSQEANYTVREIMEAKSILIEYYDLENPKANPLETNSNIRYYHPKAELLEKAKANVFEYEVALTKKALRSSNDVSGIMKETNFDEEKVIALLTEIAKTGEEEFKSKAELLLRKDRL